MNQLLRIVYCYSLTASRNTKILWEWGKCFSVSVSGYYIAAYGRSMPALHVYIIYSVWHPLTITGYKLYITIKMWFVERNTDIFTLIPEWRCEEPDHVAEKDLACWTMTVWTRWCWQCVIQIVYDTYWPSRSSQYYYLKWVISTTNISRREKRRQSKLSQRLIYAASLYFQSTQHLKNSL